MLPPFANEPYTDFTQSESRRRIEQALARVAAGEGRELPLRIGGREVRTGKWLESRDPAAPETVVARVARAGGEQVHAAVESAEQAFAEWSRVDPFARARVLLKAAAILRREKHDMSALMVREAGKSWGEADGDTAEAIDFLEFYAREMMRLAPSRPVTPWPGEENDLFYLPLGVGAVIPPWNFPCAILVGMTAAALVTGNSVILKPSSDTPVVGYAVAELFERAGLPPGVLQFLPGSGGEIGDTLVGHPRVRFISFTGSREVGLRINELAARAQEGQRWIKRVVAEMGGKDAIVVDASADLDAAADGIVQSAFGYQGQKCSACSRAILHDAIHDEILDRIEARAQEITVGPPADPGNWMGPVINKASLDKILSYIKIGRQEGRLRTGGEALPGPGYFLEPTIFEGLASRSRLGQEEIFGPVLACIRVADFDEALRVANDTEYGLTGACYSSDRSHLERARREFHVGNLYLNRKCTGALVDVQPFGGFNMSGTDSKAGGRDYLKYFLQAKAVAERL